MDNFDLKRSLRKFHPLMREAIIVNPEDLPGDEEGYIYDDFGTKIRVREYDQEEQAEMDMENRVGDEMTEDAYTDVAKHFGGSEREIPASGDPQEDEGSGWFGKMANKISDKVKDQLTKLASKLTGKEEEKIKKSANTIWNAIKTNPTAQAIWASYYKDPLGLDLASEFHRLTTLKSLAKIPKSVFDLSKKGYYVFTDAVKKEAEKDVDYIVGDTVEFDVEDKEKVKVDKEVEPVMKKKEKYYHPTPEDMEKITAIQKDRKITESNTILKTIIRKHVKENLFGHPGRTGFSLGRKPGHERDQTDKEKWDSMHEDERMTFLHSHIKDPDEADRYLEAHIDDLPNHVVAAL